MVRYPLVACFLFPFATAVVAQELPSAALSPVVLTEERTQVYRVYDLLPDCTAAGIITIKVTKDPAKGQVDIGDILGFSNYSQQQAPQLYHCNTLQTYGTSVFYTSASGFRGTDNLELEVISARGASRKVKLRITVK
jgi:hypothetical protein